MDRRDFMQNGSVLLAAPLVSNWNLINQLFGNENAYKIKEIRGGVYIFEERGGTIAFFLDKDGIAVVDTQFPEQSSHLLDDLQERSSAPIEYLINTHHHMDHTAGNIVFKGIANKLVAHTNSGKNQELVARERDIEKEQWYPDTLFSDKWEGKIGKETITATYFGAAHTDGDAVIHFENANVVHTGDLIFNRRFPYIDKPKGASIENWIHVLDQVANHYDDDCIFIFGHAGDAYNVTGNKADIRAMRNYLESLLTYMQAKILAGATLEHMLENVKSIPGAKEWTGKGIERSINAAWEEIKEGN